MCGQPRGDERRLAQVLEHAGKLEHFRVGKSAGRIRRDDPGHIGDAVEHHLRLLTGIAAKRAIRKQVEYDRVLGIALDSFGKGLHHRAERHFTVRREHGPFQVIVRLCGLAAEHRGRGHCRGGGKKPAPVHSSLLSVMFFAHRGHASARAFSQVIGNTPSRIKGSPVCSVFSGSPSIRITLGRGSQCASGPA